MKRQFVVDFQKLDKEQRILYESIVNIDRSEIYAYKRGTLTVRTRKLAS